MAKYKLSKSSAKNIKGVRDGIKELIKRVLENAPHDFGIPGSGGLRTAQEQNNLFHQRPKVTQLDGFKRKSYHQTGNAFDIFVYDEHGACWECVHKYKDLADAFKAEFAKMKSEQLDSDADCWFEEDEQLFWGGDWKRFKDLPHFEIR